MGKIARICLLNKFDTFFVLNKTLEERVINDDFKRLVEHFKPKIILTDFKKDWEIDVAKKINYLAN